jgi:hypothetical protein
MKKISIPNLIDYSPELKALEEKKQEIALAQQAKQRAIDEMHFAITNRKTTHGKAKTAGRVAELLGDEKPAEAVDRDQLRALYEDKVVLDAAFIELDRRISQTRSSAGVDLANSLKAAHAEHVRGIVKPLTEAHSALVEYRRFKNEADSCGACLGVLSPMPDKLIDLLGTYFNDAVRSSHVRASDVPKGTVQ